ncbi:MAG: protein translocase subunit SecF [Candidatus Colwellbacteria bacterium]|nr:protein translocase subunit SecF [Candidatus Colwellbacteria bacterium]
MEKLLKHKTFFLYLSLAMIAAGAASILVFGFKLGIDFKSGSLWQLGIPNTNPVEVKEFFINELKLDEVNVAYDPANQVYSMSFREISEADRQTYLDSVQNRFGNEVQDLDFLTISPSVSAELRQKAFWAIGLVMLAISLYLTFAFRKVSRPISSWKYGLITLITLVHDVVIPAGFFAFLGHLLGITVDTNFVVALLVVMGFSVHDTIVVFDRIRENLLIYRDKLKLSEIIDQSIKQTIHRSINTSLTVVLVLLALYFMGPASIKLFTLAILVGVINGTYSSIFFASPLLLVAQKLGRKR